MPSKRTNTAQVAAGLFDRGFNCAQSVLASFTPRLGISRRKALKLASMLGGGVARRGQVCGAVSGGLLALGLGCGADEPAGKEAAYALGQDFLTRFEGRYGSLLCAELLDGNISTPEGRRLLHERGAFARLCPNYVHHAAEIVEQLLMEMDDDPAKSELGRNQADP
jgi:C_GCAxxG_C_C family probable redox protein